MLSTLCLFYGITDTVLLHECSETKIFQHFEQRTTTSRTSVPFFVASLMNSHQLFDQKKKGVDKSLWLEVACAQKVNSTVQMAVSKLLNIAVQGLACENPSPAWGEYTWFYRNPNSSLAINHTHMHTQAAASHTAHRARTAHTAHTTTCHLARVPQGGELFLTYQKRIAPPPLFEKSA